MSPLLQCTQVVWPDGEPPPEGEYVPSSPDRQPVTGREFEELFQELAEHADPDGVVYLSEPPTAALVNPPDPSWSEYLEAFDSSRRPYLVAARKWLLQREGPIPCADEWCNQYYLAFSDGRFMTFTWRAFGAFVAACLDQRDSYIVWSNRSSRAGLPEPARPAA